MFSVGLLYSSRDFLRLNLTSAMTSEEFYTHFKSFKYSTADKILQLCFKCGWSKINLNGFLALSERGIQIANCEYQQALLLQLEDLISNFNPPWASLIVKGRAEIRNFLPFDVLQCFKESGLLGDLTDELISFWDKLALAYRGTLQKRLLEIGRIGEKLSYEFEKERTNKNPLWQAIESNLAGYDLLSIISDNNHQKLKIEVKTISNQIEYGLIHISKNEWETACSSINYIFHLWHLEITPKQYIISVDEMQKHIPKNNGNGIWESVEIPFKSLI